MTNKRNTTTKHEATIHPHAGPGQDAVLRRVTTFSSRTKTATLAVGLKITKILLFHDHHADRPNHCRHHHHPRQRTPFRVVSLNAKCVPVCVRVCYFASFRSWRWTPFALHFSSGFSAHCIMLAGCGVALRRRHRSMRIIFCVIIKNSPATRNTVWRSRK